MDTDAVLALIQDVSATYVDPRFRALAAGEVSEKNPGDLVTIADQEAEVALTEALTGAHPGALVLGEEAHSREPALYDAYLAADHAFTVDPVDGTKNFVHGSPDHAVMVSEVRAGEVTRAWIWQPQHGRAFVAERGAGAFADGERLRVPEAAEPWRGVTSYRRWLGRALPGLAPLELTWVSCGIDYPHVVVGDATYLLYSGNHPWDHAPGALLLSEAGGYLGDLAGGPWRPRVRAQGIVGAVSETVADDVRRRVAEAGWPLPRLR